MSRTTTEISRVDPTDHEQTLGLVIDVPAVCYSAVANGSVIAIFGLAWKDGRCWLFFEPARPLTEFRHAIRHQVIRLKRVARQLGEQHIYIFRDKKWPSSAKLVRLMGFEYVGEENGEELHVLRLD